MDYLMMLQLPAYAVSADRFRIESAFAEHLRVLREKTKHAFDRVVVLSPSFSDERYQKIADNLEEISASEGIVYRPLHEDHPGVVRFWLKGLLPVIRNGWPQIGRAGLVHTSMSYDIRRPYLAILNTLAFFRGKKIVFVVDIDNRRHAGMRFKTGRMSRKSYLLAKYIYNPPLFAQVSLAVRCFSLVLLKSPTMVADFGKGRPHVRNFFDTNHSDEHIIAPGRLKTKMARLADRNRPLKFVFFGRLVSYKGLDHSIRAIARACDLGGRPFEFSIIGNGEEQAALQKLVGELGLGDRIHFRDPLPYGQSLFECLYDHDICLATPMSEDTPRAAFDAMAAGMPVLAYDINYYRDLEDVSGAVVTAPWPEPEGLAERMVALDADRARLVDMSRAAVEFAAANTQEIWMERRMEWTFE